MPLLSNRLNQIINEIENKENPSGFESRLLNELKQNDLSGDKFKIQLPASDLDELTEKYQLKIQLPVNLKSIVPSEMECQSCGRTLRTGFVCNKQNCPHK